MLYSRKSGDRGETSLLDGTRFPKDDPRIIALGDIDELNALLGWCRSASKSSAISSKLEELQRDLYLLGTELAAPSGAKQERPARIIGHAEYSRLEDWLREAHEIAGPIKSLIIPGGTELACQLHIARTCCRRAERSAVTLARTAGLRWEVVAYLNELGDLLFAWSRQVNHDAGVPDKF